MPADSSHSPIAARSLQTGYRTFLRRMVAALRPYSFLNEEVERLNTVEPGSIQPFCVAVFGRMKTGKSSLINALMEKKLAITGVEEATATINRISYGSGDQLKSFTVHWKDDLQESFPLEELRRDWSGKDDAVLDRVRRTDCLELYSDTPILKDILIVDTPGTGSEAEVHENVAARFIEGQEADALVYVFPPVGHQSDVETLSQFRLGSSPYNSVAVMHKWDSLYWDNGGDMEDIRDKARILYEGMKDYVKEVLPVSAPLALFASLAPDSFFDKCFRLLSHFSTEDELTRLLRRDDKWNRDPERAELWETAELFCEMPWPSFQVALRHLLRAGCRTPQEARRSLSALSGIDTLRRLLDIQFFKQAAVIRQQRVRERAKAALNAIYNKIRVRLDAMEYDGRILDRIHSELSKSPANAELVRWVDSHNARKQERSAALRSFWVEIDKEVRQVRSVETSNAAALELLRWLDSAPPCFSVEQMDVLRRFLSTFGIPEYKQEWQNSEDLLALYGTISIICQDTDPRTRGYARQLQGCLIQTFC